MSTDPPQEKGPVRPSEILGELSQEFLQLDRGLPGTVIALTIRPASVVRAYLFQRERRYVGPLRYLLFSIAMSVLANWLVLDKLGMRSQLGASAQSLESSSLLLDHAALLTILILPFVAVAMRGAFFGLKLRYVDCLVTLAYTQAQVNLVLLAPVLWLAAFHDVRADSAISILVIVYLLWSWASIATGPAWRRWIASIATLVLGQGINSAFVLGVLWLHKHGVL